MRTLGHCLDSRRCGLRSGRDGVAVLRGGTGGRRGSSSAISATTLADNPRTLGSAFCKRGDRRPPSQPRSNLVSLAALVRCLNFHRLLRHARGGLSRNRSGQHCLEPDSRAIRAETAIVACAVIARCQRNASLVSFFSGAGSFTEPSFRQPIFAGGRVALPGLDVSGCLSLGSSASRDRDLCSIRTDRPDEQHRSYYPVQYHRRGGRAARGRFPSPASARLPVELDLLRGRLCRTRSVNDSKADLVCAAAAWNRTGCTQRSLCPDPGDRSLRSRRNPFRECPPPL